MIGIKGIHRKGLGTSVFIGLLDTRHNDIISAIVANMEVDMDQNNQIVYVLPDFSFPLDLLDTHLKLIIKSKGLLYSW